MSEEKPKRSVTITIKDLPDELNEEELEQVAGGVLATSNLQKIVKQAQVAQVARPGISGGMAGAEQYCDCWSYTACSGGMGGLDRM